MAQSFKVDFKIFAGNEDDDWFSVDQLLGESKYLVDYYLSIENLHCCNFQGGFFIDIDGKPWSDEGTVDEFWMTVTWVGALKEIWDGKEIAKAYPWEESNLTLKRIGDELELEDVHLSGPIAMPKVRVPLFEFAGQIFRENKKFFTLVAEIENEIKMRRAQGVSEEIEEKLKEIERNLPTRAKKRSKFRG